VSKLKPNGLQYLDYGEKDDRHFVDIQSIVPTKETIEYFLWFKEFADEENDVASIHLAITNQLYTKRQSTSTFKVYECFRGSAKSTVLSVYSPIYWAFLGKKPDLGVIHLVYIASASIAIAKSQLAHIYEIVTSNEKIKAVLEVVKYRESQNPIIQLRNKEGHILTIEAKAPDQKTRGVKTKGKRVDVIICDDLEDASNVNTPEQRVKLRDFYNKVLLPMLNPKTRDLHFIQTPLHTDSLLSLLKKSPNNMVIKIPICYNFNPNGDIKDGDLTWKDRFGKQVVMNIYQTYKDTNDIQSFNQEYLLELIGDSEIAVNFEDFKFISLDNINKEKYERLVWYISVDFGTNDKIKTDKYGYSIVAVDEYTGEWFIMYLEENDYEFTDGLKRIFDIVMMFDDEIEWNLVVEKGIIWNIAENLLYNYEIENNIYFNIYAIAKNNTSKLNVIKTLKPRAKLGKIYVVNSNTYQKGVDTLEYQLSKISNTSIMVKHDDLVDSLAQLSLIKDASIISSNIEKKEQNDDDEQYDDYFVNPYKE